MTSNLQAIIHEWDSILANTAVQFEQVLSEAWHASAPLVAQTDLDFTALTQAWGAVDHQLRLHTERNSNAWERICDVMSESDGLPEGTVYREGCKRDAANRELEIRHAQYYRTLMAQAAEQMRQRALLRDVDAHACSQCGAALSHGKVVSQARDVACGHCNAVVTVEPGAAWRIFSGNGARLLADAAALPDYEVMVRTEGRINAYRDRKDVPLELLVEYERAARAHYTKVFEIEASYVPELQGYVAAKIDRHMHDIQRKLRDYWQWRQQAAKR